MRMIPISKEFELAVNNKVSATSVRKANDTIWTDSDNDIFDEIIVIQYVKMFDLLMAVYESTGPGACEQQLPDAVKAIDEFMNSFTN